MNDPHSQPQPDLTAYALGELDHANDAAVHAWLLEHPEARLEVDAVADLSHALQATAALPAMQLHPEQRRAVLSGPERVRDMVLAASRKSSAKARPPVILSALQATLKFAAVAAVAVGAFLAGRHFEAGEAIQMVQADAPGDDKKPVPAAVEQPPVVPQAVSVEVPREAPVASPVQAGLAPKVEVVVAPPAMDEPKPQSSGKVAEPVALAEAKTSDKKLKPAARVPEAITRIASVPMVSTTLSANSVFTIRPAETRPMAESQPALAAPIKSSSPAQAAQKERAPVLLIHSWRAEVATCPWDESRKLVRVSLQIPGEQAAASGDHAYGLQVTFHPNHIRSYRPLCQRATPAAERNGAAIFSAWYEVVLNGPPSDISRAIGQVTLSNTRFTTAAMSPFDGSRLQLVDRGDKWEKADDDFIFESAVVGFGLLMNGKNISDGLNHQTVLNLAEQAQKAGDRTGDRARFVKLVKEARQVVGVKS